MLFAVIERFNVGDSVFTFISYSSKNPVHWIW